MESLTGASLPVFIGLTLILFGGASFMMGQALAETWRPISHNFVYGMLMGIADRLLQFMLFGVDPPSFAGHVAGYVVDTVILVGIALVAYRLTRAHRMVSQYPWLYERTGLFTWRERAGRGP